MQESASAREAMLRFCEAFTEAVSGDMETFERVFTGEDDLFIIGSAYHEWVRGRESGKLAWGMEGVGLEPGDPEAWEHGSVAWGVDRPTFVFGDVRIPIRLSVVLLREHDDWKIVQGHFSVGVPDEVAGENAPSWAAATPSH